HHERRVLVAAFLVFSRAVARGRDERRLYILVPALVRTRDLFVTGGLGLFLVPTQALLLACVLALAPVLVRAGVVVHALGLALAFARARAFTLARALVLAHVCSLALLLPHAHAPSSSPGPSLDVALLSPAGSAVASST